MVDDTLAPGADQVRQVAIVKHLGCDPATVPGGWSHVPAGAGAREFSSGVWTSTLRPEVSNSPPGHTWFSVCNALS